MKKKIIQIKESEIKSIIYSFINDALNAKEEQSIIEKFYPRKRNLKI